MPLRLGDEHLDHFPLLTCENAMKPKQPDFQTDAADPAPAADTATSPAAAQPDRRAQELAAIHADRRAQADIHTRFDASRFRRKEQR